MSEHLPLSFLVASRDGQLRRENDELRAEQRALYDELHSIVGDIKKGASQ